MLLQGLVMLMGTYCSRGPPALSSLLLSIGLVTVRQQTSIWSWGRQAMPGTCDARSRGSSGRPPTRAGRRQCTCWWRSWGRRWGRSGLSARLCSTLWPATGALPACCCIGSSDVILGGVTGIPVGCRRLCGTCFGPLEVHTCSCCSWEAAQQRQVLGQGSSRASFMAPAGPLSVFVRHAVACYRCTHANAAWLRCLAETGRGVMWSAALLSGRQWAVSVVVPPHPQTPLAMTPPSMQWVLPCIVPELVQLAIA